MPIDKAQLTRDTRASAKDEDGYDWRPEAPHWLMIETNRAAAIRSAIHCADTWYLVLAASIPPPDERSDDQVRADWIAAQEMAA